MAAKIRLMEGLLAKKNKEIEHLKFIRGIDSDKQEGKQRHGHWQKTHGLEWRSVHVVRVQNAIPVRAFKDHAKAVSLSTLERKQR